MADETSAAPQGQATPTPAQAASEALADKGHDEPFFSTQGVDGKPQVFKTKDELAKAWKESGLMRSDYTRKTQELAKLRQAFDEERKKFQSERDEYDKKVRTKYDGYDQILKTRPDIMRQLDQMAQGPATPDAVFDRARSYADERAEKLAQELEEIKAQLEEQKTQRELEEIFTRKTGEYEDFDKEVILNQLQNLSSGEAEPLVDLLYWANKGRQNPLKVEERIKENLEKKASAGMVPSKGSAPIKQQKFNTLTEAHQQALADAGIGGG